ncbi:hypothetical protein TrCOL_g1783 [Triparma columacea]|uniref:Fe2OG dioxygenase domain-containing protein n=1 Tax=Triparma columacea TaxID=722753 RepID=A0A9W7LAP2_9STRA|nr:hypothetical protein TrCOL_g1783 [Triparma columacea]
MLNTKLYPFLSDIGALRRSTFVEGLRRSFLETGVATIPEFLSTRGLHEAVTGCQNADNKTTKDCYVTDDDHNAYLLPASPDYPPSHIRNRLMRTKVASLAGDELPPGGALLSVYENVALRRLVQSVVFGDEKTPIYLSSDPLGRCSVNVFKEGWKHSYHFDESEFSTTLMLQKPLAGGTFEYTPRLRKSQDEYAFNVVEDVIENEDTDYANLKAGSSVKALQFEPGTLSIFAGRYSLHRVSNVEGPKDRLVAVFTFAREEGFKNSPEVQKLFWGRTS